MSFDVIKNYLKGRMEGLKYSESSEPFDFDSAASTTFSNKFILYPVSGELEEGEGGGEKLNNFFDDTQIWRIKVAFLRSQHNDIIVRDNMIRGIEEIIKDIDDPSNWVGQSNLIIMKYENWEVEELENYFVLTINIKVIDRITY